MKKRLEFKRVQQVMQLVGHVAVVDVGWRRTDLAAGQKGFEVLSRIVQRDADVIASPEAARAQR